MDIDSISETVIRHKIKRLVPHQLKQLYLDFIHFKVEKKDLLDDFKIHETVEQTKARLMKKFQSTARKTEKSVIPTMVSNVSKEFPEKLFVIKSDKKKPY